MRKIETDIPDVLILEPDVHGDSRGFFFESYREDTFNALGITSAFIQDNHSRSRIGTVRGLHYQLAFPQAKLCRVIHGDLLDVAVDIRRNSPTFGRYVAARLSAENRRIIYVPHGFAHGFAVLSETAELCYKCDDIYHPEDEYGIAWNDPDLGIPWNIGAPILSEKDSALPRLSEVAPDHLPLFTEETCP